MGSLWADRQEQWRRFARWEDARLRQQPEDYTAALAWMSEAWELAKRYDPGWGSLDLDPERFARLARIRAALARIPGAA